MAVERGADRGQLGKANAASSGLDPVIRQSRHAEDAGCIFLGKPQGAPPPPQRRADAGLGIVRPAHRLLLRLCSEQSGAHRGAQSRRL